MNDDGYEYRLLYANGKPTPYGPWRDLEVANAQRILSDYTHLNMGPHRLERRVYRENDFRTPLVPQESP